MRLARSIAGSPSSAFPSGVEPFRWEGTSRRSVVLLDHVVALRKSRAGSTKSHPDWSWSGVDFTKDSSYFDEPSAERGNRPSHKQEQRIVFQERRIANDKPFVVFEEWCMDLEERCVVFDKRCAFLEERRFANEY